MVALIKWGQYIYWRPNLGGILRVLRIPELLEITCRALDMRSLQSLRATCKYFANALASHLSRRLRNGLSRWFGDARMLSAFQVLLQTTETIVGGSFALSLLCPGDWEPGDLDIIVREAEADRVRRFLIHQCQFVYDEERSGGDTGFDGLYPESDSQYEHFVNPILGGPGIDLVTIYKKPELEKFYPADFVLTYHSTVVMNFWNGKHLYCLWPDLTFNGLYVRNLEESTPKLENALQKYWSVPVYSLSPGIYLTAFICTQGAWIP
ncbi:hypothetical protein BDP27DRAFT_1078918 [Rhodocollybia butyracea]|uniref:F-box domain-containing protein n=1 Tax=Rhodocollybia butyracea TaxID=206335 RepID=A0A9P5PHW6_9AGAR|nr:hypothetical protein BDP27DRAFT_1078918 [Rhodocollybia butyracea]